MPALLARDPEWAGRFQREARLLASLNHPHIAAIHGIEQAGDTQALVILAGAAEPTEALDPHGKVRERLRSCVAAGDR